MTHYNEVYSFKSKANRFASLKINPLQFFLDGWRNRHLVFTLVKREILARYRGSFLGTVWWVLLPLFMLLVYTFVFSVVFEARWNIPAGSKGHFVTLFFLGLVLFNFMADSINVAPRQVLSNPSYVKKVVFPLEILAWVDVLVSSASLLIGIGLLTVMYLLVDGLPPVTALFFPIVLFPFFLIVLGLVWFLASLGVFFRDLPQFVTILTSILLFLSPIFYPITAVPESFRVIVMFSPLTLVLEKSRAVFFWGQVPDPVSYLVFLGIGWLVAWLGYAWFCLTKRGFADVI